MDFCRFDTRLWSSPQFAEVLTSLDRYMLFYLFTNHHISLSGCCRTGFRTIAGETGLDQENIRRCLKHLHETGSILYDASTKEIFVKGWISCNWGGAPRRGAKNLPGDSANQKSRHSESRTGGVYRNQREPPVWHRYSGLILCSSRGAKGGEHVGDK